MPGFGRTETAWRALVWLRDDLRPGFVPRGWEHGHADGAGVGSTRELARAKAIAEAVERWAFYAHVRGPLAARWGFGLDPSTSGMAAFPGSLLRARRLARLEAVERHALACWERGLLPSRAIDSGHPAFAAREIVTGRPGVTVVMARARLEGSLCAFGSGAAGDLAHARTRALSECLRDASRIVAELGESGTPPTRALPSAWDQLRARVEAEPDRPCAEWRLIVDRALPGPWDRHARVWRTLYAAP